MSYFGPSGGAAIPRDYGSISSSSSANQLVPDVSFSTFSPTEFITLSQLIAQNIQTFNYCCKQLEKTYKLWKSLRIKQEVSPQVQKIEAEADALVQTITMDFSRLAAIVGFADKQQKLQLEKLTNDFHLVLEKYSSLQKLIAISLRQTQIEFLKLLPKNKSFNLDNNDYNNDNVNDDNSFPNQSESLQIEQDDIDLQFLEERADHIKKIENAMLAINSIMSSLRTKVEIQGESVGMFFIFFIEINLI